jgi:TIR domain
VPAIQATRANIAYRTAGEGCGPGGRRRRLAAMPCGRVADSAVARNPTADVNYILGARFYDPSLRVRPAGVTVSNDESRIFICFSSKDAATSREIVSFLEADGLRCWISFRDVAPGKNYQEAIVDALEKAAGIIFLFSKLSAESAEIRKELSIAASCNIPVFPVRLAAISPSGALRYELAIRQWIDIFPDREAALRRLAEAIRQVLADASRPVSAVDESWDDVAAGPHPVETFERTISPSARTGDPRAPVVTPGSQEFEAIRALLARRIGPIAKVFVQKAAVQARTPDDFCEQLATHVSAPSDRAARVRSSPRAPLHVGDAFRHAELLAADVGERGDAVADRLV